MWSFREGWITAKNLLFASTVFRQRERRQIWNANFNRKEYLALNPDVARSYYPAALHYLIFGNRDSRDPSTRFSTRSYLARHPDVGRAGINALVHFAAFGRDEGRLAPVHPRNGAMEFPTTRVVNVRWPETDPLVSIVIRGRKDAEAAEVAVQSVAEQTYTGIEVIIGDGSGEIAAAKGRYICRLDAHTHLTPTHVEVAVFLAEVFGQGLVRSWGEMPVARLFRGNGRELPSRDGDELSEESGDQKRSVLFALPFLAFGGGVESLFRRIAGWAGEAGWTPLVTTSRILPPEVPQDPSCFDGVTQRVYPLAELFQSDRERLAFVHYLIQRYRVRVLVLGGSEAMYTWLPAIKAEYPDLTVADHLFNGVGHAYDNHLYRSYIDGTVVQSDCVAREIQQQFGDPAGELWRIPLGVEIPHAAAPTCESGKHDVAIGFFGRLSREKGPDLFVEIAKRLVNLHPGPHLGLRFIIAGDGPEKDAVQELIRSARLEPFVNMAGFIKPVLPLMRQADIAVLPSRIDGMPAAVLEAQALGIPVVASNVGGLPEIIHDGETGYLCPAGDIELFCDRIGELIRDPELRRKIGNNARRSVEKKHGVEQMKTGYLQLLEELTQRKQSKTQAQGNA